MMRRPSAGLIVTVMASSALAVLSAQPKRPSTRPGPPDHDFSRWSLIIHRELAGHLAGGYAFAVSHGGRVVGSGTFGWARTPWETTRPGVPWSLDTPMGLASVSKPITATALLHLWDEKQHGFSLDAPFWPFIQRIVPNVRPDVKEITIRQLLMHRSGITNAPDKDAQSPADLRTLLRAPLEFAPGSQGSYHNNNYYILRLVLEQIAGEPYTKYVEDHVLHTMDVEGMDTRARHPLLVSGYGKLGNRMPSFPFDWDTSSWAGAAGWYGLVNDLSRFLLHVRDPRVLSREAWQEMYRDRLGWDRQQPGLAKGGDWGWSSPEGSGEMHSAVVMYPDDVQAVLLINSATPRGPGDVLDDAWSESRLPVGPKN